MKPKIEIGKSMAGYLKAPGESASLLKKLILSPLHYQEAANSRYAIDTVALAKGTAFHALMESETVFRNQYAVSPKFDRRTKAGKEDYAAFQIEHDGKTVLSPDELAELMAMRDSVMRIPKIRVWVDSFSIDREVNIFWMHPNTGLRCKARADLWDQEEAVVLDYKTCQDASPAGFERAMRHWSYDFSAVHYEEGTNWTRYGWICVESRPPYAACLYWLEPSNRYPDLQDYRHRLLAQLVELKKLPANEPWPSYGKDGESVIRV